MTLAHFSGKLRWLEMNSSRSSRVTLEAIVIQTLIDLSPSKVAPAIRTLVALDTCHAVLRNRFWLSSPIFSELLVEYLSDDYYLNRDVSIALVEELVVAAQNLPGEEAQNEIRHWTQNPGQRDKEFLRYVFVATATAACEDQLVLSLGLGTKLLRRIKGAAESAIQQSSGLSSGFGSASGSERPTMVFVPEVDALFAEIMMELSREARLNSFAIEIHRLRFHLLKSAKDYGGKVALDCSRAGTLFSFLLSLGKARQLNDETLDREIVELALASDLAFVADCSNRFGKIARTVALTPLGEEITAGPFASELMPRVAPAGSLDHALVLSLPACYQQAVVKALSPGARSLLPELLETYLNQEKSVKKSAQSLSPGALEAALKHILLNFEKDSSTALLEQLLDEARPSWIRVTTCSALGDTRFSHNIRQLLAKVAECDSSHRVKDAAREALAHIESS